MYRFPMNRMQARTHQDSVAAPEVQVLNTYPSLIQNRPESHSMRTYKQMISIISAASSAPSIEAFCCLLLTSYASASQKEALDSGKV